MAGVDSTLINQDWITSVWDVEEWWLHLYSPHEGGAAR